MIRISLIAATIVCALALGAPQGFGCDDGACGVSAHQKRYFQAQSDFSTSWQYKLRLLGQEDKY